MINPSALHTPGGSSQNSLRGAQLLLPPGSTFYTGATGTDDQSDILAKVAASDGLKVHYQKIENQKTGSCAVLVNNYGSARSLVANVAAAQQFSLEKFKSSPAYQAAVDSKVIYCCGFFLFSCPEAVIDLAKLARNTNKKFVFNLSASFVCSTNSASADMLARVLPLCDVVICNSMELQAYASARGFPASTSNDNELLAKELIKMMEFFINNESKSNENVTCPEKRFLVVTQGPGNVIVVDHNSCTGKMENTEYSVPKVPKKELVDKSGAGDAFAGGYLAQLVKGNSVKECVNAGIWIASHIIRVNGVVYPKIQAPESFLTVPDTNL